MGGCIDLPLEANFNTDAFNLTAYHSNRMELRNMKEGSPVLLSKLPNVTRKSDDLLKQQEALKKYESSE